MGQIRNQKLLNQIAHKIKQLRAVKEKSQEQVYNDTNVHVARIESGKANVSISTLYKLCDYFNITLGDFFNED